MKIIRCTMKSGSEGFKVIDLKTDKPVFTSFSRIDCEQYIYARRQFNNI